MWYHVSAPNSYLVVTGAGIETVKIKKKALVMPFQRVTKISITPFDFSMSLHAMTSEKLKFSLPAVFTIGPRDNLKDLEKYAVLLTGNSDGTGPSTGTVATGRNHVQDIVKGIIEGETRSIVSTMTMEELFAQRQVFKNNVIKSVQSELDQFGLCIYNANVKELQDMPGSQYFEFLSKKAHEGAQNQAKVDVANARMIGEVGEAERQGETKQKIAKINAHTAVLETERKSEKIAADAKLKSREISIERELQLERISASRAADQRDAELQKTVEQKKAEMELERLRATVVTKAKIDRESAQEKADASAYAQSKSADAQRYADTATAEAALIKTSRKADAELYAKQKDVEGALLKTQKNADAHLYAAQREAEGSLVQRQKDADANLYVKQREAAGLLELAKAYGALADVLGGPQGLMQYFMLQNGVYEKMADANARAIQGLQPKISVWNTGDGGQGMDTMAPIRNLVQCLPPMLQTVQEQTGIRPPGWFAQMPEQETGKTWAAKENHDMKGVDGVR
ncbi:hypothetical protein K461DRAFT_278931 [Myriangium duriaei CBS 260.36]|uniref:Band 7 domain-containing protein n=1 Tax=Myriangium duriaei CBS 260.36 TaxID=1168546 RepID=A0A9P4MH14_9PEZI|nr:hypothetical protein K461DRAFT_278931 [Myriangium duriaei CBS 260.36]